MEMQRSLWYCSARWRAPSIPLASTCKMSISFLYFDLGNVLCTFCHDRMCWQIANVAGVPVEQVMEVLFDGDSQLQFEAGQLDADAYYEHVCRQFGKRPDRKQLELAANDIFSVNTPILPLIERLATAGNRLGILSNTNVSHWQFVNDGRFAPLLPGPFEQFVLSYEERLMKPDTAIYQAAIARAGVPPPEVFFTDDRDENVAGARQAGIDAVVFDNVEQLSGELQKRGVPGA